MIHAGEEPRAIPAMRRVESPFTSRHGHKLCAHTWERLPAREGEAGHPKPVAVFILSHGYSNYTGAFFDWKASVFTTYGVACHGVDHFAHGNSDGLPAFIPDMGLLVDDFEDYARTIKAKHPGLPVFAYGESMGGAVVLQVARRDAKLFDGIILMAPMAGFDDTELPHWLVQVIGKAVAALLPWAPITPTKDIQAHCFRDPQRILELGLDPHRYAGKLRLGTAFAFKAATAEIQASLHEISTPFLILHGTADVVTSPTVSRALFDRCSSTDKSLVLYEGSWHVLWWETHATRKDVLSEIVRFIHERSPAAEAAGLATPPVLPHARLETKPTVEGPFRIEGPLYPWTYKSHGRSGVPVVELPGAPSEPEVAPSEASAAEEEG